MTNFSIKGRKKGCVQAQDYEKHGERGKHWDTRRERNPGRAKRRSVYAAGRKYGKRRPASFSSIRFELLSSRRALSIVAENYFIIARSVGLKCSPLGGGMREGDEDRREARTENRECEE